MILLYFFLMAVIWGPFLFPMACYSLGCAVRGKPFAQRGWMLIAWYYGILLGLLTLLLFAFLLGHEAIYVLVAGICILFAAPLWMWGGGISIWLLHVCFARPTPPYACRRCRYDLTGNVSGTCPECGREISPEQRELLRQQYTGNPLADPARP
jgi:hypothetical protein